MSEKQIEVSKELFDDIIFGEYEDVDTEFVKHDVTAYTIAFPLNGKHYIVTYYASYNNGIEDWGFPLTAYEAKKVEKTVEVWERL